VPADLVSLAEVKSWLGNPPSSDDSLLTDLADRVEVILEQTKRRTFVTSANGVVVKVDGTGMPYVWLERPVGTLTNVKIGLDAASPDETLLAGLKTVIAQGRRVYRQDGGIFPRGVANVQVTFDAAAQLDLDAKQAVLDGVAFGVPQSRIRGRVNREHRGVRPRSAGTLRAAAQLARCPRQADHRMSRDGLVQVRGVAATIESLPETQNSRGEPIAGAPSTVASVNALIQPLSGDELLEAQQLFAKVTHRILVTPYTVGVTAKMRLNAGGVLYDIGAVLPVRPGRDLDLLAEVRGV
jgi:SPP1 family predicted phage head-tail adaptor